MNVNVLITGATGNIGGRLVPLLSASADTFTRVLVRDIAKGEALASRGCDVVLGEFDDGVALAKAVDGIDTVVMIAPPGPNAVKQNRALFDAARNAGVRKIVRISAIKASADGPTENTRLHAVSDSELVESGMNYVILRPNYFMQNLFLLMDSVRSDNALYAGMSDGRTAMIDARDVVDCAAAAVLSDQFDNEILELSGPASISFYDIASCISEFKGEPVTYHPIPPEAVKAAMLNAGFDEWLATLLKDYSQAYATGFGDFVTANVTRMSGHPARAISDFVREELAPSLRA